MIRQSSIIRVLFVIAALGMFYIGGACAQEPGGEEVIEEITGEDVPRAHLEGKYYQSMAEASYMQDKVLRYYEKKYGFDSVESVEPLEALAWMSMELNDYERAAMFYKRVIRIRNGKMPPSRENTTQLVKNYYRLGDVLLFQKKYEEAESYYDESIRFATDMENRGDVVKRKGFIYEDQGDYTRALNYYLESLKKYELASMSNAGNAEIIRDKMIAVYNVMAEIYRKVDNQGKYKEYQRIIEALKSKNVEPVQE